MENVETEFKNYLGDLLNRAPKPESNITYAPAAMRYGQYMREFNREGAKKLDELLLQVRDQPEETVKLTNILTEYRTKLMTGQF